MTIDQLVFQNETCKICGKNFAFYAEFDGIEDGVITFVCKERNSYWKFSPSQIEDFYYSIALNTVVVKTTL